MTFDNWVEQGQELVASQGATHQFAIADWLLDGDERFGQLAYDQAEAITGFARQTLYDYVCTARAFPPSYRNYAGATFNHYRACASVTDDQRRDRLMSQAAACTVGDMRRKVAGFAHTTEKPRVDIVPIAFHIAKSQRDSLQALASLREVDLSAIVQPLIATFLDQPDIRVEKVKAARYVQQLREYRLEARREKWIKNNSESIEGLIREYGERNEPSPDPRDFVKGWELRTGRKFTPRVFNFAMEHTGLAHFCGTRNREDYGFAPSAARKGSGKRYHYKKTTPKQLISGAASRITDILPSHLKDTWLEINNVSSAVKAELISRRLGHTQYFDTAFRRAIAGLKKEGKVQIEEKRIRKAEAA